MMLAPLKLPQNEKWAPKVQQKQAFSNLLAFDGAFFCRVAPIWLAQALLNYPSLNLLLLLLLCHSNRKRRRTIKIFATMKSYLCALPVPRPHLGYMYTVRTDGEGRPSTGT